MVHPTHQKQHLFWAKKLSTIDTNDFCEKNAPKYKMIFRLIFFLGTCNGIW
jgi:hypothetical protein